MALTGIKFDFINIISIPLLVGIGIDDSVHINHRYLIEGGGRMKETLAKTGSAVALTTITTMIGFSSFIPSLMRAMRSNRHRSDSRHGSGLSLFRSVSSGASYSRRRASRMESETPIRKQGDIKMTERKSLKGTLMTAAVVLLFQRDPPGPNRSISRRRPEKSRPDL